MNVLKGRLRALSLLAAFGLATAEGATTRYVSRTGSHTTPFTSWSTAATNIQKAVDVCGAGDVVLVSNGTYSAGGRALQGTLTNRVAIDRAITVRSTGGPTNTFIVGYGLPVGGSGNGDGAVRCVYLTNGATLAGFTLTNGHTLAVIAAADAKTRGGAVYGESMDQATVTNCILIDCGAGSDGGGACQSTLLNCVLTGNAADGSGGAAYASALKNCLLSDNLALAGPGEGGGAAACVLGQCVLTGNTGKDGGGAHASTLINCTLYGNTADANGGGAYGSTLINCTVASNATSGLGGGAYLGALTNCIVYYNTAADGSPNYHLPAGMIFCCAAPLPSGPGNIALPPSFVYLPGGNVHLQANSPCLDAGTNIAAIGATDLDGNARIRNRIVDMGAYEYPWGVDAAEPDNSPRAATLCRCGETQRHSLDGPTDVDWIMFYPVPGFTNRIEAIQRGSNSNVRLDVYLGLPDGTLSNVPALTADSQGAGLGLREVTSVNLTGNSPLSPGLYYVRVSTSTNFRKGETPDDGSDYDLDFTATGGNVLAIVATSLLDATHAPPNAWAVLDGGSSQFFGSATCVSMSGVPAGTHTVEVRVGPGYLLCQGAPSTNPSSPSTTSVNPVSCYLPDSSFQCVLFIFAPSARARGLVRDGVTGQWLNNAALAFRAVSGVLSNFTYTRYQYSVGSNWCTLADGAFPTNVWLPAVAWDLTLARPGYSNVTQPRAITSPIVGATNDLGTLWMSPADGNGNGLADDWETLYFPGSIASPTNDADHDGYDNLHEFLCGTDPTNAASAPGPNGCRPPGTNGFTLAWTVTAGRAYQVNATPALTSNGWPCAAGPWTATNGQTRMEWTDPTNAPGGRRFYRVEVQTP